jgi:hypothetical protein
MNMMNGCEIDMSRSPEATKGIPYAQPVAYQMTPCKGQKKASAGERFTAEITYFNTGGESPIAGYHMVVNRSTPNDEKQKVYGTSYTFTATLRPGLDFIDLKNFGQFNCEPDAVALQSFASNPMSTIVARMEGSNCEEPKLQYSDATPTNTAQYNRARSACNQLLLARDAFQTGSPQGNAVAVKANSANMR